MLNFQVDLIARNIHVDSEHVLDWGRDEMSGQLPTPVFLTNDAQFTDYRPAINRHADVVIFERTPVPLPANPLTTLYMITNLDPQPH